ncbi:MAG: hypothetical protein ACLFM7_06345 [Bacteroidales bacterium]
MICKRYRFHRPLKSCTRQIYNLSATLHFLIVFESGTAMAQPVVMAWGKLKGIRVEGQLMEFDTSLRIVEKDWGNLTSTRKERQLTEYQRDGKLQITNLELEGLE